MNFENLKTGTRYFLHCCLRASVTRACLNEFYKKINHNFLNKHLLQTSDRWGIRRQLGSIIKIFFILQMN